MTIKELFNEKGMFGYFATLPSYEQTFGDLDPDVLDSTIVLLCGERPTIPLSFDTVDNIYSCIWTINKDSWGRIWKAWLAEYDVLASKMQVTMTETGNSDTITRNYETTGKRAAYDTDTLLDDTSDITTDNTTKKASVSGSSETTGTFGVPMYKAVSDEIKMRKNDVLLDILRKAVSYLVLDIY